MGFKMRKEVGAGDLEIHVNRRERIEDFIQE